MDTPPGDQTAALLHIKALECAPNDKRSQLTILARSCVGLLALVDGGLDETQALDDLTKAGEAIGLKKRQVKTAWNRAKNRELAVPESIPDDLGATVLIPGTHYEGIVDGLPKWREQTISDFTTEMLTQHPRYNAGNKLFLRGGVLGEIKDGAFKPLSLGRLRCLLVPRAYKWVQNQATGERQRVYTPLTADLADLIRARAESHPMIDKLRYITRATVITPTGAVSQPGWNDGGVWDLSQRGLGMPEDPHSLFLDLLQDWPWQSEADRQNAIGALLTVFLRPYIKGNIPLQFVVSTTERTGKTLYIEAIIGGVMLGGPVPAMQLNGSDEEKDKRIFAQLLRSSPVVHIDNVRQHVDSSALASLITASIYSGRMLGQSQIIDLANDAVWFASGNNVTTTGEIAKRSVPIRFLPPVAHPELRTDFAHPDVYAYVQKRRSAILATLAAMFAAWRSAGEPACPVKMGGFSEWARIVGGVMYHAGFTNFMGNYAQWIEKTDPEGMDMVRFVEDWITTGQSAQSKPSDLRAKAVELGLFERTLGRASSERAQDTAFAMLLRRYLGRVIATVDGDFVIVETFDRNGRLYGIEKAKPA